MFFVCKFADGYALVFPAEMKAVSVAVHVLLQATAIGSGQQAVIRYTENTEKRKLQNTIWNM